MIKRIEEKELYLTSKNYSFLEVITIEYRYAIYTLDSVFISIL